MIPDNEPKEVFLSHQQIKEKYINSEISLETLISCLAPGLICFKNPTEAQICEKSERSIK